jgi:O-antigen/teichoic acid export membrane protein
VLEILNAFTKTSGATVISLVFNSLSVKILAEVLGPAGIGLFSILKQIQSSTLIIATIGGQGALVQGAASRDGKERDRYLKTVLILFSITGVLASVCLLILAPVLAERLTGRTDRVAINLIRLLVIPILFTIFGGYANGVLNVDRAIGYMAVVQIVIAFAGMVAAYPVSVWIKGGFEYALIIPMLISSVSGAILYLSWLYRKNRLVYLLSNWRKGFDPQAAKYFVSFAGATIVSGLLNNLLMLSVRGLIVQQSGLAQVGIFDSVWTFSVSYLTLITGSFGSYYLPTLSALTEPIEIRKKIQDMLLFVNILSIPLISFMMICSPFILQTLFSKEFLGGTTLLKYLLFADYFKLLSWTLSMPMIAFANLKIFIVGEIIWNLGMFTSFYWVITQLKDLDLIGICVILAYISYLLFTLGYAWQYHRFIPPLKNIMCFFSGLTVIILAFYVH